VSTLSLSVAARIVFETTEQFKPQNFKMSEKNVNMKDLHRDCRSITRTDAPGAVFYEDRGEGFSLRLFKHDSPITSQ